MFKWLQWVFCTHNWEQIDKEVITPSPFKTNYPYLSESVFTKLLQTQVIWLFQCNKCKRVKTIKETT